MIAKRIGDRVQLAAETVGTGSQSSGYADPVNLPGMVNALAFVLDVQPGGVGSDTADTLDVYVQTTIDGTNWIDVVHFVQCAGSGGDKTYVAKIVAALAQDDFETSTALSAGEVRHILGDSWRVRWAQTDDDSDADFTIAVWAMPM